MKTIIFFIAIFFLSVICNGQDITTDTTLANKLVSEGHTLITNSKKDSAYYNFNKAGIIYKKYEMWQQHFRCRNIIVELKRYKRKYEEAYALADSIIKASIKQLGKRNVEEAQAYFQLGNLKRQEQKFEESIKYYNKALNIYLDLFGEFHIGPGAIYNSMAGAYLYLGEYASAIKYYQKGVEVNKVVEGEVHFKIASGYNNIGVVYYYMGDYDKVIEYCQKAVDMYIETLGEKTTSTATALNVIGMIYFKQSKYKEALEYFNKSLGIFREVLGEKNTQVAGGYLNIANVNYFRGSYEKALELYQKTLESHINLLGLNHSKTANALNNIGNVYQAKGNDDLALEYFLKALNSSKSYGKENPEIGDYYFSIGSVYKSKGSYELAREYFNRSLNSELKYVKATHPKLANTHDQLGLVEYYLGNYDLALKKFQFSVNIHKENHKAGHPDYASTLHNIANVYSEKGSFQLALDYHNKSINMLRNIIGDDHKDIASIMQSIGELYRKSGNYEKALEYFQKSLALRQKVLKEMHPEFALSYIEIGETYYQIKNYEEALKNYQKAISIISNDSINSSDYFVNPKLDSFKNQNSLLQSLQKKALVLSKFKEQKYLEHSVKTFELTDQFIIKISQSYSNEKDKVELGKTADKIYKNAVKVCLNLYKQTKNKIYLEKAFYFSERNKSNVLQNYISDVRAKQFAGIPDSLLKIEKELKSDIAFYTEQLVSNLDTAIKSEYSDNLFSLKRRYEELILSFEKNNPNYYQLKYNNNQLSLTEIQSSLESNTALIEYFSSDNHLFSFIITKDDFKVEELQKIDDLDQKISSIPQFLKEENIRAFSESAYKLYSQLIKPLNINTQNILIIPDGALWQLNFDLLLKSEPKVLEYKSLPYMIRDHNISYGYSAKLLKYKSFKSKEAPKDECLAFSYNNAENVSTGNYIAMRGEGDINSELIDLPGTRKEIEAVSSVLSGAYYYGTFANERNFKANAKDYNILHLALHGMIDNEDPMNSRLFFTQDKDSVEDNYLHAFELYNLELNAELAVLSACNTGSGKIVKGEGIMSLGRAFTYAGCKSLLLSQWDVSDAFTPGIMKDFYANLKEGKTKSASLREAKLAFLESADNLSANPYFWAPLVQLGDDRPLKQDNSWMWYIGVGLLFVVILIIYKVVLLKK